MFDLISHVNFLASPTPNISENATESSSTASPTEVKSNEESAKEKLNINTTDPTTTLQIRLADGTRLATQFNLSHTVGDIQQYIEK